MRVCIFVLSILATIACPVFAASEPVEIRRSVEEGTEIVQVTTSLLRYTFSAAGGTMRSAFVHFASYGSTPLDAVPGWGSGAQPTLAYGVGLPFEVWLGEEDADLRTYTIETTQPTSEEAVVRIAYEGEGLRAEKAFRVGWDDLYTMDVDLRIRAPGEKIRVIVGHRPTGSGVPDLVFLYDGKTSNAPLAPGSYAQFQGLGLVGKDRVYFLRLAEGDAVPFFAVNESGHPVFGVEGTGEILLRGTLYTGRNRYVLLEKAGLAAVAPVGFFSQFLVWVMKFFEWLYHLTGNYGWAILLFTLITRIIIYPLMRNQYRSMAKMQRLAPKLQKLQEKYKDDRQTLQQQMMELYRQEKVNPLGGCLPLLLQFPILILLWQAIMYSAEQIHLSPAFLWLSDLSQPDPYYIMIVLATGAQLVQQWLTQRRMPEQPKGGAQMVGWVLPIVMALLFLSFPAGLWLYWFASTLLQIGQQMIFDLEMARETARTAKPDAPPAP
jgi:YidC/Oxa1 family membrane protein insertase